MTFGKFLIRALSGFEMAPPVVRATSGAPIKHSLIGGPPVKENPDQVVSFDKWWWSWNIWDLTYRSFGAINM